MRKFLECCAGMDIGKRELTVTILTGPANVEPVQQTRTFGTTMQELNRCLEWLQSNHCTTVVMESTGSYWTPVWNVLHPQIAVIVANPEHVKARRGEKTDPEDSRRLAERLRVGAVRGSFIPGEHILELRGSDPPPQAAVVGRQQRAQSYPEAAGASQCQDRQRGQRRVRYFWTAHSPSLVAASPAEP